MMKKKILCILLLSLMLCSCAEVPDDVKDRTEILSENESNVDNKENLDLKNTVKYCTLEEIRNSIESDIKSNNSNIKVDTARVGTGNIMPVYDIEAKLKDNEAFSEICSYIFEPKYNTNDKSLYHNVCKGDAMDDNYPAYEYPFDYDHDGKINNVNAYWFDINSYEPESKNESIAAFLYGTGCCWGTSTGLCEEYYFEQLRTTAVFSPLIENIPDDISYKMRDGNEWMLNDAIIYAEEFYNSYLTKTEMQECKYLVQTACVQQFDDGTYGYLFEFVLQDVNGNYYECEPLYPQTEEYLDKIFSDKPFPLELNSYIWMYNKEEVSRFKKDIGISFTQSVDDGKNILTLNGAITLLNSKLAEKKAVHVKCAELNYVLYCKDYDIWKKWYDGNWYEYCKQHGFDFLEEKEIREGAYLSYNALTDCELQIRPTWVFKTTDTNLIDYTIGETYYVDAVTGEIQVIR